ncbi:MAG TPA: hypothetical protein VGV89_04540 [Thermoplasmata archaeon]|nr:hypothetical protein [Thermoplasmata archaeon]
MNDVTSKIAYAYAKQQVFVYIGLVLVGVGAGAAAWVGSSLSGRASELVLASDLAVLGGGAALLAVAFPRTNLESINHAGLRIVLAALVVKGALLLGAWLVDRASPVSAPLDVGIILLLVSVVVGYPLPIRRGGTVLYSPVAVRALADTRSLTASFVGVLAFGAALLALPAVGLGLRTGSSLGSVVIFTVVALAAAGLAVLFALKEAPLRANLGIGLAAVAGLMALLLPVVNSAGSGSWWSAAPFAWVAFAIVVVVLGLSYRLNRGKTIVSRRA